MALDKQTIIAINTPPSIRERRRTLKSGRQQRRFSLTVEAEPIVHVFNEREMGRGPAEAITDIIKDRLLTSGRKVKLGTERAREGALKAFNAGSRWAVKRYSGGRIGATPPDPTSNTYGVDSGRLAKHMFARFDNSTSAWNVNPPANRLTVETFTGAGFEKWLQEFANIIDIKSIVQTNTFKNAQSKAIANAIQITRGRLDANRMKVLRELLGTFRAAGGVISAVL